jgi:hypothetical protein
LNVASLKVFGIPSERGKETTKEGLCDGRYGYPRGISLGSLPIPQNRYLEAQAVAVQQEFEEDLKRAAVSLGEYIEKKKGTLPGTGEGVPIPELPSIHKLLKNGGGSLQAPATIGRDSTSLFCSQTISEESVGGEEPI